MRSLGLFRALALAAGLFSFSILVALIARNFSRGRKEDLSASRGYAGHGLIYAFGKGMVDKESVRLHRLTFLGGLVYHGAVFAAFGLLLWTIAAPGSRPLPWFFLPFLFLGALAGLGLLGKRTVKPVLRRLSCPDDFFANLLVDAFLVLALLRSASPSFAPAFLAVSIVLLLYVPLGKIRHCVFFFVTRALFGLRYGRRGALPGTSREEAAGTAPR